MASNFYEALTFQAILQIPSFSLPKALASNIVHVYSEFVGRRSSHSKRLDFPPGSCTCYELYCWICIFLTSQILPNFCKKCSYICTFRQPMYMTLSTTKFHSFYNFSSGEGSLYVDLKLLSYGLV